MRSTPRAWRVGASCFLDAPYDVERCPATAPISRPIRSVTFAAIPVQARYRFMLEEAEFTIMGFIKGPVCRGQVALNVIEDRFWVLSSTPTRRSTTTPWPRCCSQDSNLLRLPTGSSNARLLVPWLHYARLENEYALRERKLLASELRVGPARDSTSA